MLHVCEPVRQANLVLIVLFNLGQLGQLAYTAYLTNITLNGQIAQQQNGSTIVLEHRYYGQLVSSYTPKAISVEIHECTCRPQQSGSQSFWHEHEIPHNSASHR